MKKTRRSLIASLVTLLLCSAMFIGSTFAWFTDTVSNTGNRIQAGTLKVDLLMNKKVNDAYEGYKSIAGGQGDIFKEASVAQDSNVTLWEPGKTQIVYLAVKNKGNLALNYKIYLDVTDEGLIVGKDSKKTSLEYAILPGASTVNPVEQTNWTDLKEAAKALDSSNTGDIAFKDATHTYERLLAAPNGKILASEDETANTQYFALAVHMKEDAGNEYQGKDAIIDVTVVATQATVEEDGFGNNQYDASADYDKVPAPVHETAQSSIVTPETTQTVVFAKAGMIESAELSGIAAAALLPEPEEGESIDMVLNLNVDTAAKTSSSITYNIDLYKTITKTKDDIKTVLDPQKVDSELSDWLSAVINVGSGLKGVVVTHSGNEMDMLDDAGAIPTKAAGGYYYDEANGYITIKAKSFSPFEIKYDVEEYVAKIDNAKYLSLDEAVNSVPCDGLQKTIVLLKSAVGNGIVTNEGQNIVIDFDGHTYSVDPTVGSSGTKTNGFQLLKGSKVELKNGTLTSTIAKNLVQNYSDLTATNMLFDGTKSPNCKYVLSLNCGAINVNGNTSILANDGECAFDVCWAPQNGYPEGAQVVFNTTGKIDGNIYFDPWGAVGTSCLSTLTIKNGEFNGRILVESELDDYVETNIVVEGGIFNGFDASLVDSIRLVKGVNKNWFVVDGKGSTHTLSVAVPGSVGGTTKFYVDGNTENTYSFQTLCSNYSKDGDVFYVPSGNYYETGIIIEKDSVSFIGLGDVSITKTGDWRFFQYKQGDNKKIVSNLQNINFIHKAGKAASDNAGVCLWIENDTICNAFDCNIVNESGYTNGTAIGIFENTNYRDGATGMLNAFDLDVSKFPIDIKMDNSPQSASSMTTYAIVNYDKDSSFSGKQLLSLAGFKGYNNTFVNGVDVNK